MAAVALRFLAAFVDSLDTLPPTATALAFHGDPQGEGGRHRPRRLL